MWGHDGLISKRCDDINGYHVQDQMVLVVMFGADQTAELRAGDR